MKRTLHVSLAALFGALGFSSSAFAITAALECPPVQSGNFQTSAVPSRVTLLPGDDPLSDQDDSFLYEFRVCNTSDDSTENVRQVIRDWELPFFGTALDGTDASKITNVTAPEGWTFSIEEIGVENEATGWEGVAEWQRDGDPWKVFFDTLFEGAANNPYNTVTHVLHFYTGSCERGFEGGLFCGGGNPIPAGEGLGEALGAIDTNPFRTAFQFTSPFGTFNAPYQASWQDLPVQTGDPDFPLAGQANDVIETACANTSDNCDRATTVPEPGSLALLAAGLGALAHSRRKRKDSTA